MATLERGKLVWVLRGDLADYLEDKHVPEVTKSLVKKVSAVCFERQAEAVVLFLDESVNLKNVKLSCYLPIYKEVSIFEQGGYTYEEIDGCISLFPPLFIKNIRTITSEKLLFAVKDMAIRSGYWREEYGIVALR